jgi:DNA repair exonuclease SbcCD ATPase subunit
MLKSMGLTPEEQVKLTEDIDRSALEQSGVTDKAMQDAIIAQLEAERPDLTKTQGEITALESALKDAQEQVNEFKTAFKEGKSIMAAAESFSSQLKGLSDGTVTASQVLETINSANGEALTKIAEATKKMSDSMVIVDNQNKIIEGVVAKQKVIAQRLGIQIGEE